jgi:tol-pal system protein YbgF
MKRTLITLSSAVLVFGAAVCVTAAPAQDRPSDKGAASTPARETVVDLLLQVQALQDEVRNLRGQVEVQTHEIERLKTRERDLLADLDRRVRDLERRGVMPAAAPAAEAGPGVSPAAPVAASAAPAPAAASASAPAPAPVAATPGGEVQDYEAAFALMKQGYYERGAKSFREFIAHYPKSSLAGNAQYWIGEASYYVRSFRVALDEFSKVVKDYPTSAKVPDALLKIGYSQYELGNWAKAREALTRATKDYPNTSVAKSAEARLTLMKKEGH